MPERPGTNGFSDPRFWVSLTAVLLTVGLAILGGIYSKLNTIESGQMVLLVGQAKQDERLKAYEERLKNVEGSMETQTKAYNYNFNSRLSETEAELKSVREMLADVRSRQNNK